MSSTMSSALKSILPNIVVKAAEKPKQSRKQASRPIQYINGYQVQWISSAENRIIPVLSTDQFYIQYPIKKEDIELPVGTTMATYNSELKQVEYYSDTSNKPIKVVHDQKHEPLPLPKYLTQLETVEELYDIDMETGDIITHLRVDILEEAVYWNIRLKAFEENQLKSGVSRFKIDRRLKRYYKSLLTLRGITEEQLNQPIPDSVLQSIEEIKKQNEKQR